MRFLDEAWLLGRFLWCPLCVSRAARAAGFSAREWELLKGDNHDLTRPVVLQKIQYDIKKGLIIAAMLAPPCSSFSPARDRTRVIRSRAFPWGIAGVSPHEVEKLEIGNACILAALKIIKTLDQHGGPGSWRILIAARCGFCHLW